MESRSALLPVCAMVLVTLAVWIYLYITRVGELRRQRIHPQVLADAKRSDEVLKDVVNPSDNFENLFEVPVLFYVLVGSVLLAGLNDIYYIYGFWLFVSFRAIHSFIHCTYNKIMHRFTAYAMSSSVVWFLWLRFTVQLLFEA